jgi:hypothetical protein
VTPPKATLAEQWRLVQELLDEAELQRVEKMTPEQIEAEAKTGGIGEERSRALLQRAIDAADAAPPVKEAPSSNVVPLSAARRRRAPGVTLTALAIAAGVAAVCYVERKPLGDQWQAWFHPGPVPTPQPPPPLVPPKNPEESPLEKARRLRAAAYVDIDKGYFDDAADELDEARYLDPAGNADPRVTQARQAIVIGNPKRFIDAKTGVESWEYPLHKRTPVQR